MSLDYTVDLEVKEETYTDLVSAGDENLRLQVEYLKQKNDTSTFDIIKSGVALVTVMSLMSEEEKAQIQPIFEKLGRRADKIMETFED